MKKKAVLITAIIMLAAVMLAACEKSGGKSETVGTWKAKSIEAAGVTMKLEEYTKQTGNDMDMSITFKEDKSFSMKGMGAEGEGTWEEKDDTITAILDGQDQNFKLEDGKLLFEDKSMGDVKIIFEK